MHARTFLAARTVLLLCAIAGAGALLAACLFVRALDAPLSEGIPVTLLPPLITFPALHVLLP